MEGVMEGWRDGGMEGWRDGGMEGKKERKIDGRVCTTFSPTKMKSTKVQNLGAI